jgi:hypothetical protein
MSSKHFLPSKLPTYLRRLKLEYAQTDKLLLQILDTSRFLVVEETGYDNWNGGTYGHDVVAFLPAEVMKKLRIADEEKLGEKLRTDLNVACKNVPNEFFRAASRCTPLAKGTTKPGCTFHLEAGSSPSIY